MSKERKDINLSDLLNLLTSESVLVIDAGTDWMKIANIKKMGNKVKVNGLYKIEGLEQYSKGVDKINVQAIAAELQKLVEENKIKTKNLEIVYSNKKMQTKIINVKNAKENVMKLELEAEIEKSFASFLEEGVYLKEYASMGQIYNKDVIEESVLVVLAEEDNLKEYSEGFKNKGYKITDIQPSMIGFMNVAKLIEDKSNYKILINMGNDMATILFTINDVPFYIRNINFGFKYLTNKLQGRINKTQEEIQKFIIENGLKGEEENEIKNQQINEDEVNVDEENAEEWKDDYIMAKIDDNEEEYDEIQDIIKENLENFIIEIEKTMAFVKQNIKFEPENIYMTGGFSKMKGLKEEIEESLQIKVIGFEEAPLKQKNIEFGKDVKIDAEYAILIGNVMRGDN